MPHPDHHRAAVLILAMLLMAAIIGSTISLSTIISDSGHQSQSLNDFIKASLLADSNLERGLAVVKVGRSVSSQTATKNVINGFGGGLTATTPSTDTLTWSQLGPRQSVTFDISNSGSVLNDGYRAITVTTNRLAFIGSPNIPGEGAIDLYWVGLNSSGDVYFSGRKIIDDSNLNNTSLTLTSFDLFDQTYVKDVNGGTPAIWPTPATTYAIRLRLTAFDKPDQVFNQYGTDDSVINTTIDTLQQVKVSSAQYNPGGGGAAGAGFPSRISISSTGKVTNSQTIKSASVLWQLPSSSVFNYVIFTEGGINPE